MSDTHLALPADGGPDDLPRTLRREREAREREARAKQMTHGADYAPAHERDAEDGHGYDDYYPVAVHRLEVPFFRLMFFFIKAVFAAVPALIILLALLWGAGELLQRFFPELIKMQILIHFPN